MLRRVVSRSLVGLAVVAMVGVLAAPQASAYGPEQFQTAFSFNCNPQVAAVGNFSCTKFGFWGWCTFGGNGSTGDCQITIYNFNGNVGLPTFGPTHLNIDYTGWTTGTGSFFLPTQPTLPAFFATGPGTMTLTGPGAGIFGQFFPSSFTCPATAVRSPNFICDTGIPAVPGHYTNDLIPLFPFVPAQPGLHFDVQVTRIA
jgi:hypothetical protein